MAIMAMVKTTFGFCGIVPWQNVSGVGGCSLKVHG